MVKGQLLYDETLSGQTRELKPNHVLTVNTSALTNYIQDFAE